MMNSEGSAELRRKAEEILTRAKREPEFKERLRTEASVVLEEGGLTEQFRSANMPLEEMEPNCPFTCVDFTCIFSNTACPQTCLPFGTVVMCDAVTSF